MTAVLLFEVSEKPTEGLLREHLQKRLAKILP